MTTDSIASLAPVPRPLPRRATLNGPHVTRAMRRSTAALVVVWIVCAVALLVDSVVWVKTIAAGLVVPGGGFLLLGHPVWFVIGVLVTVLCFFAWWASGFILLIPLTTAATIGLALALDDPTPVEHMDLALAGLPVLIFLAFFLGRRRELTRGQAYVAEANTYLRTIPRREIVPDDRHRELDDYDLGRARHLLDMALQPQGEWAGFDVIDQIRESALRYQISSQSWAMSFLRHNRLPAFSGYLEEAQRRTIDRMTERKVWSYWAYENLWGNFRWNPEPIRHNNIMYSGYTLLNTALHQQSCGDTTYLQPGSIELRWNDATVYHHDQHTVAQAVRDNFERSATTFYACEPHWIFVACNQIAWAGLLAHDRANGTALSAGLSEQIYDAMLLDYADQTGRATTVRSQRFGFAMPFLKTALGGDLMGTLFMSGMLPDVAERTWALAKRDAMRIGDGKLAIDRGLVDSVDPANYTRSDAFADTVVFLAATELGDREFAEAARTSLMEKSPPIWTEGRAAHAMSNGVNNFSALGTFGGAGTMHELLNTRVEHRGPMLISAAYPDVLVRSALSDGEQLRLVLSAGETASGPASLVVGRLEPVGRYRVSGSASLELTADQSGRARFDVQLGDRTVLTLAPER